MAVAYRSGNTVSNASSGTNPVALTGQATDDILVGVWMGHPSAAISATASGWTTLNNSTDGNTGIAQYFAIKKAANNSEVFNPTWTGTAEVWMFGFSGEDTTLLYDQFGTTAVANATTFNPPSATPLRDNGAHILIYGTGDTTHSVNTAPSGYTPIGTSSSGISLALYYKLLGAGTAGNAISGPSLVWNTAAYGPAASFIVEAPSGGGGSGTSMKRAMMGMF